MRIDDLRLTYPSGAEALRGLSLEVPPGCHLGLVGPSGSGKSSLLKVLARMWPASGGDVLLDGHPLWMLPEDRLRAEVAYVPQRPQLFEGRSPPTSDSPDTAATANSPSCWRTRTWAGGWPRSRPGWTPRSDRADAAVARGAPGGVPVACAGEATPTGPSRRADVERGRLDGRAPGCRTAPAAPRGHLRDDRAPAAHGARAGPDRGAAVGADHRAR
ncbi:ATP-binding cassette domain-containing protein [Micromonospora sp. M12]